MIVLDANILISAMIGVHTKCILRETSKRGVALAVPEPQAAETLRVLVGRLNAPEAEANALLAEAMDHIKRLSPEFYQSHETLARQRLHPRAQPDWPVLAAALAAEGAVWSHDRDFFGAGVPVWSSRNLRFAA